MILAGEDSRHCVDETRETPANVDVPKRILELLDLSVGVYGVEDV